MTNEPKPHVYFVGRRTEIVFHPQPTATGRSLSFGVLHVGGNVDIEQEYLDAAAEAMNRVAHERVARGEKP